MKISELIKRLKVIQENEGNLDVRSFSINGSYNLLNNNLPEVRNLKILEGREQKNRLWQNWYDEKLKGEKIVII